MNNKHNHLISCALGVWATALLPGKQNGVLWRADAIEGYAGCSGWSPDHTCEPGSGRK